MDLDFIRNFEMLEFSKKIVLASDIVSKVLSFRYNDPCFFEPEESYNKKKMELNESLDKAWGYVLNIDFTKHDIFGGMQAILQKYNFSKEEIYKMAFEPPDYKLLAERGCSQAIVKRAKKPHIKEVISCYKQVSFQSMLRLDHFEILNYLEALEFDGTLKSKGGWQGADTKFIIESWEKIDKLFGIGTIPPEIIEKYKKTAKEVKTGGKDLLIYLYFNLGYKPKEIAIMLGLNPEYENNIYNRKEKGKETALELGLPDLEEYRNKKQ